MIRVLIVAPTPALRAGLRALVAEANVEIVGETVSLTTPASIPPDTDVILAADDSVLTEADRALGEEPRYAVLLLSDDERQADVLRRLPLTAWGLLSHDAGAAELVRCDPGSRTRVDCLRVGTGVAPAAPSPVIGSRTGRRAVDRA